MEHFFSPNSSGDLRSDAHQSHIIRGDADVDHTQIIGGDNVKLLVRIYPPIPPGFRHPCLSGSTPQRTRFLVCCMKCQHFGNDAIVILITYFLPNWFGYKRPLRDLLVFESSCNLSTS